MALAKHFLGVLPFALALAACGGPRAPGMTVVASSARTSEPSAMLVAFPSSACTGSESAVFIDQKGGFVGAVAPGTAAYLAFPPGASHVYVVSSRDVTATAGTWFSRHEIAAPGDRVEHGVVVGVGRVDAKNCYRTPSPHPEVVTYDEATQAARTLTWLDVRGDEGTLWLDEHRARVTELLGLEPKGPPPAVTSMTRVP